MRKFSCIAVDDDPVAIKIVSTLIEQSDILELKGTFLDPVEATNAIFELNPEIIFLDVEMPAMSGLELIKSLKNPPEIILITSKKDYAIEAFDLSVTDYVVKPIDTSRFLQAVSKAKENLEKRDASANVDGHDHIFVKVDSLLMNIGYDDIYYLEAYGDYVKIHTATKMHLVLTRLKNIEEKLPEREFARIHRSYIVRIEKIENIDNTNLQIKEKILPISISQKKSLLEKINLL